MTESQKLNDELKSLEAQRRNGEISVRDFYSGLLEILSHLKTALVDENITDKQAKKQVPLLLAFIKTQISDMESRGQ